MATFFQKGGKKLKLNKYKNNKAI